MEREKIVDAFCQLGKLMCALGNDEQWNDYSLGVTQEEYQRIQGVIGRQFFYNGWFTRENVLQSLLALGNQLNKGNLNNWLEQYSFQIEAPKKVAVIMAGNIPLVGFNDFLCVLLSGHHVVCKLSSDDKTLLPVLVEQLIQYSPELKHRIEVTTGIIRNIDAVIATGSDNSVKYFEQYFGKYPHIFRKNRTSVAVLKGDETPEELERLGNDIFAYFGLGCRNVSHLILPKGFELNRFFEAIVTQSAVINHNKYGNNYDYNKAVYLMNQIPLFDNNFVLLRETSELFSPLAMIHYHFYENQQEIDTYLQANEEKIQVIVGKDYVPFGTAQCPTLNDYADNVDTMSWLGQL